MLRALAKTTAAVALKRSGLLGWAARSLPPGVPRVVTYHRIVEDFTASSRSSLAAMLTSRAMFERHLEWMARHFQFVTLDEVGSPTMSKRARPQVAITFDDGYRDLYHVALPVLTRMGIPAAVFVVSSLVGSSRLQRHDRLFLYLNDWFSSRSSPVRDLKDLLVRHDLQTARVPGPDLGADAAAASRALLRSLSREQVERVLDALGAEVAVEEERHEELLPLTWEMLGEMARRGVVVGSHTRSHVCLPLESPEVASEEIRRSKQELEAGLGARVDDFAYPDGQFDEDVVSAVARAGFARAYVTCRHWSEGREMLTIPRILLWERASLGPRGSFSPEVMRCQLEGVFDRSATCEHAPKRRPRATGRGLERKLEC